MAARVHRCDAKAIRMIASTAHFAASMAKIGRVQLRPVGSAFDDALQQMMGRLQTKVAA